MDKYTKNTILILSEAWSIKNYQKNTNFEYSVLL